MENEVVTLIKKLDETKNHLIYAMMENKAEKQLLNSSGIAALMYLRDTYSMKDTDLFIASLVEFLEEVKEKYNIS